MKNGKSVNRPALFVVTVVWCMAIQPAFAGSGWGECRWMEIGRARSHQAGTGAWCPEGFFLTQLDLDGGTQFSEYDAPVVGAARCSSPMAVMEVLPLDQVDLKLTNLAIIPPPEGINGPKITLHAYRSYRVEVSIQRNGIGQVADFKVRTECVRGGTPFLLGETMVSGPAGGGGKLGAVYDIFPSSAGYGDCLLRTIIDADNVVAESDESPLSNIWERQARITR